MKSWLIMVLKATVSFALLYVLVERIDVENFWVQRLKLSVWPEIIALMLLLGQAPVLALRWQAIIRRLADAMPFFKVFNITCMGLFFNQTLPASVGGDLVRIVECKRAGLGFGASVNSVLLERLSGLFCLVLILAATLPFIWNALASIGLLRIALAMLLPLSISCFALLYLFDRCFKPWAHWKMLRFVFSLSQDFSRLFFEPFIILNLMILGLFSHLMMIGAVYCLGRDLGLEIGFLYYSGLMSATILATVIPVSIAGWGVREGVMVVLFGALGVNVETAMLLSVLFGLALMVSSIPGGILWLLQQPRSK